MKIELALVETDERRWMGLVKVEGEVYKIVLFPGSATTEWRAVAMTGAFTGIEENSRLYEPIRKAVEEFNEVRDEMKDESARYEERMLKELLEDPNLIEELKKRRDRSIDGGQGQ